MVMLVGENFNLEKAVCNHGYFMMAPNLWMPSQRSLTRPLRLNNNDSKRDEFVAVSITLPRNENFLIITAVPYREKLVLSFLHKEEIRLQVARMLRISAKDDKMVEDFHKLVPEAKNAGFARIFRSPTLFEDIIKSLLLCSCPWKRSLEMAQALCDLQRKLYPTFDGAGKKRKRSEESGILGNFPSPKEIASLDEKTLNKHCNLGFRASIILEVARNVENGSLNLAEDCEVELLRQRLMKIKGFGPFTVANIMMCLGVYQEIPVDSETIKHLQQVHGKTNLNKPGSIQLAEAIEQVYGKYAPFQCLVYWMERVEYYEKKLGKLMYLLTRCRMERVEYYEKKLGKLSELPHSQYCNVTTMKLNTCDSDN
ncbi:DNA-(apurinic or apyrimidinic site) lyase [Handroanthus impetiginosus]|uniref:DNA-(Apurinic or apyrimidinic site) lyase n=1 Tax=Handroanthus impetiginosus TaxID=429701 RepID=A0A2G9G942_9LAMI|nr:DNA-(apurinic or apyrimidinic site) lyase [Handroanthus impetiginosus]